MLTSGLAPFFENAAACLFEHPGGYVFFQYKAGKRHLADLQAALTHTADLLHKRKWYKLLGDQRLMAPFTDEETAWVITQWLTGTQMLVGDIHAAVLVANDVFARLAASQLRHDATLAGLVYRTFEDETQAAAWLASLH